MEKFMYDKVIFSILINHEKVKSFIWFNKQNQYKTSLSTNNNIKMREEDNMKEIYWKWIWKINEWM